MAFALAQTSETTAGCVVGFGTLLKADFSLSKLGDWPPEPRRDEVL